jgi:hypothetical protein
MKFWFREKTPMTASEFWGKFFRRSIGMNMQVPEVDSGVSFLPLHVLELKMPQS